MSDNPFAKYAPATSNNPFAKYRTGAAISSAPADKPAPDRPATTPSGAPKTESFFSHLLDPLALPVNLATAYPRDIASNLVALTKEGFPTDPQSAHRFEEAKSRAASLTKLPEDRFSQAVESAISYPLQKIGEGMRFVGKHTIGPAATETIAPYLGIAADIAPIARVPESVAAVARVPGSVARRTERLARKEVSRAYRDSQYEGGPSTLDVMEDLAKARHQGQPMALADVENPAIQRLAGSVYRGAGAAPMLMRDFFKNRAEEASNRVDAALQGILTNESSRNIIRAQAEERAAKGKPLWDLAMAHGSMAPFERQFELAFSDIGKQEKEAARAVADAERSVTQARGRQATAGNVYSTSGANRGARDAERQLSDAQQKLRSVTNEKQKMLDLLRRAQEDRTLEAPGATWSPGLQRLLEAYPELRKFIANGIAIERRFAAPGILEGQPFHPRDYAIVGLDEAGEPIIGTVPTMRAWHAAKIGLDQILSSPESIDQLTRRLNMRGNSYLQLRRTLVNELDRLNGNYKPARDMWAGDSAIVRAASEGRQLFNEHRFPTVEDIKDHMSDMADSEKQAFIAGVKDTLQTRLSRITDPRDKGQLLPNGFMRERLKAVLGSDARARRLLDFLDRESRMKQTGNRIMAGSQTAERAAADLRRLGGVLNLAEGVRQALHMNPAALHTLYRWWRGERPPSPAISEAIAKILTDPKLKLSLGPELLPTPIRPAINPNQAAIGTVLGLPASVMPTPPQLSRAP